MIEDQLILLAAVFAARADSSPCESLWHYFNGSEELFEVICSLWPEVDDPIKLQFLFKPFTKSSEPSSQDLFIKLIETDNQLISMVEMDTDTIVERCNAIRRYAKKYMSQVPPYEKIKLTTALGQHIRKRLIICNELSNEIPVQYEPVWQDLEDKELSRWISGIVKPLHHFNKRLKSSIKIKEFEKMDPLSFFYMILNSPDNNPNGVLQSELLPYLTNGNYYQLFLSSVVNIKEFPLDTKYNFEILYHLLISFSVPGAEANLYADQLQRQCALIIFKNGPNYLRIGSKSNLNQLLLKANTKTQVGTLDMTVENLLYYSQLTDDVFNGYTVQELYAISKDDEAAQQSHFASLARRSLETVTNQDHTLTEIAVLLNHEKAPEETVFSRLSEAKQLAILVDILLEKGNFLFLQTLISKYRYKMSDEVLVKYFWHYFNMASNGLRNNKDLINAERIANLLLEEDNVKYQHLRALIDVVVDIAGYKINLGKKITFKPSYLLKFEEDPYGLISVLLESDGKLYQDVSATYSILQKLQAAFKIKTQEKTDTEDNLVRVLVLHIDHALANMDFQFAYENTKELLKRNKIIDYWPTILQVGKFIDPNWLDGETPTEIIFLQLEILGELLHICPVDQVEAVASQWSALELELVTRDLIKDPYSLEKTAGFNSLMRNGVTLNGFGSSIVNFLSSS